MGDINISNGLSTFQFERIMRKLDKVESKVERNFNIERGIFAMSVETDAAVVRLTDQIAVLKTSEDAAVVLINSIPGLMAAAGVPAATIDAVTASLKTNAQPLLDAIAAVGTQTAPPGPVIEVPPAA